MNGWDSVVFLYDTVGLAVNSKRGNVQTSTTFDNNDPRFGDAVVHTSPFESSGASEVFVCLSHLEP